MESYSTVSSQVGTQYELHPLVRTVSFLSDTHTKLIVAEVCGVTANIQVEHIWQSCSWVRHHDEVGQKSEPMIRVRVVQYVVPSGPMVHFWLWNELYQLFGHLSPVQKERPQVNAQ
jgi:hypothetical protein